MPHARCKASRMTHCACVNFFFFFLCQLSTNRWSPIKERGATKRAQRGDRSSCQLAKSPLTISMSSLKPLDNQATPLQRYPITLTTGPLRKRGPQTNRQPSRQNQLPQHYSHKHAITWTSHGCPGTLMASDISIPWGSTPKMKIRSPPDRRGLGPKWQPRPCWRLKPEC